MLAEPPQINGSLSRLDTAPHNWAAQFMSPRGVIHANLSLIMSEDIVDEMDGYVEGVVIGKNRKKESIRQPHLDGQMLGFDATLTASDGAPLRISVLGKKTRNKIIFRIVRSTGNNNPKNG